MLPSFREASHRTSVTAIRIEAKAQENNRETRTRRQDFPDIRAERSEGNNSGNQLKQRCRRTINEGYIH